MSDRRIFLGWDQPCLATAARWLRHRYESPPICDMSQVIIVLPGARAGRRLLEHLTESSGILIPPRIITLGTLPSLLFESPMPIASSLQSLLTRAHTLRLAQRSVLEQIIPQPPEDDDLLGWLALARDLGKLDDELAAEALSIEAVIAQCEKQVDFNDAPRWQAIDHLAREYRASLNQRGLCDTNGAQSEAIAQSRCHTDSDIILLALTDLPRMFVQMLSPLRDRVTALVHAPESEQQSFDHLGCVIAHSWSERVIEIDDRAIEVVNRSRDQAMLVAQLLDTRRKNDPSSLRANFHSSQITIGLGDDTLAGPIQRTLALADQPTHWAGGRPVSQSRPALLLTSLSAFVRQHRLDDFASLLRHPDIERYLLARLTLSSTTIEHWLSLLDRYISEHLASRHLGEWLGDGDQAQALKQVYDAIIALLPPFPQMRRSLPSWSQSIADLLTNIYAQASLNPQRREESDLILALEAIASVLREQAALDPQDATTPIVSFADALALTHALLAGQAMPATDESNSSAIELLGWLELMLDDAPALLITGFNEHHIPQSTTADAFLPNHLRQSLGLVDNARRYARDAAALTAMLHSKKHLTIIAGRRGHDDEPLAPSRLLLTGDGDALAQRVLRFYPKHHDEGDAFSHSLLALAKGNQFLIPAPQLPRHPIEQMNVTWFKDYLACPYRFYLKHIETLRALDDHVVELDGLTFGSIAHDVLHHFGESDLRDSQNPTEIAAFLKDLLHDVSLVKLGDEPPVAARLQLMQLEERLHALAHWQAAHVKEGWHILPDMIECKAQANFAVEDGQVAVHGRIDRIDRHDDGRYRIIDYKTGDKGETPDETHLTGPRDDKQWCDLQLPLYRELARSLNITGKIELGYVLLPKKLESVGLALAPWTDDQINDAIATAHQVIASIRGSIFWPPSDVPKYTDELSALCMDDYDSRGAIIERVTCQMEGRS